MKIFVSCGVFFSTFLFCSVVSASSILPLREYTENDLPSMSIDALLSCINGNCLATDWDVGSELARRLDSVALLSRFQRSRRPVRRVLLFAMYLQPFNADVSRLMRRQYRVADKEMAYYAMNYGAKQCDRTALRALATPPYLPRAECLQWTKTIELYGTCGEMSGVPLLLSTLDNACLNEVDAAENSLRLLFPGAPKAFSSLKAVKTYFTIRARARRLSHVHTP